MHLQDLTWFINPNTPDYFEQIHLEHGYIHGEVNATTLHITVRLRLLWRIPFLHGSPTSACGLCRKFTVVWRAHCSRLQQPCIAKGVNMLFWACMQSGTCAMHAPTPDRRLRCSEIPPAILHTPVKPFCT